MSTETYADMIEECENLNKSIQNVIAELKTFANQVVSVTNKPTEKEVIELYNKSQLNGYAIDRLYDYNKKLDLIFDNLRRRYCAHDRVVDHENFDIAHTCYVCSKCGLVM
jgi:hypothetical protein